MEYESSLIQKPLTKKLFSEFRSERFCIGDFSQQIEVDYLNKPFT